MKMQQNKLPKGWEIKKLGEVVDIINGKNQSQVISVDGKYPIYGSGGNIMGFATDYICEKGTTIIGRKGNISNPIFINERFWNVDTAFGIYPKNGSQPKFINYLCQTIDFKSRNKGTTIPSLVKSDLKTIEIYFPTALPEQQRIVSILDEAFAAIAKAKANAEQNLKNAKELFESYLQRVFEKKGEGWEEKRFDEVCILQRGFDLPTHSRNEGIHPLVSSNGITDRIDLWKVKAPGVVTGRSGTIGNVHFVEEDYWPLNTALYIKEFHGNYERFVYYFLKQFDLGKYSSGAGVPTLNRNNVHSEMVWFPKSIKEQQTIVQKFDALSAETQKLEAVYRKKIADLEELKKSLLQKAFSGEL